MQLSKYAKVIVQNGIAVQSGDLVKVNFNPEHLPLVREVTKEAYLSGAVYVKLDLRDPEVELARARYICSLYTHHYPDSLVQTEWADLEAGYSTISITAPSFEKLESNLLRKKVATLKEVKEKAMAPIRKVGMENRNKWVVVNAPTIAWANSLFPNLESDQAFQRLNDLLDEIVKLHEKDPVKSWYRQDVTLKSIASRLNAYQFDALEFKSDYTELYVRLVRQHVWTGGTEKTSDGRMFLSNIPVEEVWTMPDKWGVSGHVRITKPFNLNGQLIEGVTLYFQEGKVVKLDPYNEEFANLIGIDDGGSRLGEVALVSKHSSVAKAGVVFNSTLLDENAASHIAFGQAYASNVVRGVSMNASERDAIGMNESAIHQDVMIGDEVMDVYGVRNNKKVLIMKNGEWCFTI
ncbi:aminopeptidase [Geomicrobium sediminis]|uniref:Aminopeptidase n=1 Tax=Geomicrobium sediminis TaxID=1347788 RepID=A0ABS2PCY3_9BACL|nr:aminopeptidase [Geomicrobium sediminis]MBM7633132.1 aminopeptidase [Geomicrobium sediminis]